MKAIRVRQFGGPEVLQLESISVPQAGPGQVLVRLKVIGVNPVDTYLRGGSNSALALPYTPGFDGAGIVETIGADVTRVKVGDRVYMGASLSGTYAEAVLCDALQVHALPEGVSYAQGAALHVPYATAHRALFHRGQAKAGETVFIHGGSGGVGLAAIQLARAAGLRIIATAGTDRGRDLAKAQGAHVMLNHHDADYLTKLMEATGGKGVDLILEMLSNVNLGKDLTVLARNGRVIVIGSRGKVEIAPRDLMTRDADIRGVQLFNATAQELVAIHAAIGAGLENGTLRPIIGRELPLADATKAHVAVMEPGAYGKIVLTP